MKLAAALGGGIAAAALASHARASVADRRVRAIHAPPSRSTRLIQPLASPRVRAIHAPPSRSTGLIQPLATRRSRIRVPAPVRTLAAALARARAARPRRTLIRREVPVVTELFRMAVSAGLTPTQTLRMAAPLAPPRSGAALSDAVRALDLGTGLAVALDRLRHSAPELSGLADALGASGHLGVAVEDALARLGHEARASLRRAAEAKARTVPVRLLFPLVLCVLPAFALLGVAPSVLAGLAP